MSALSTFMTSPSGYVSRREGVSLGWMAGAVAGTATFFGMTTEAAADNCPFGYVQCGTSCTFDECSATARWRNKLCQPPGGNCVDLGVRDNCNCPP